MTSGRARRDDKAWFDLYKPALDATRSADASPAAYKHGDGSDFVKVMEKTIAAMKLESRMSMPEVLKAEAFTAKLSEIIYKTTEKELVSFEIAMPIKLPVGRLWESESFPTAIDYHRELTKSGRAKPCSGYYTKSMLGGERIIPIGAYLGKRSMIFQFMEIFEDQKEGYIRTTDYTKGEVIEMNETLAFETLGGFKEFFEQCLVMRDEDIVVKASEARKTESAADSALKLAENPLYGSW